MKKTILLSLSLVALAFLAWFTYHLINTKGISNSELIAFGVEDIDKIDRIIITDAQSNSFEIIKNKDENIWTDKDGGCVQQGGIEFMLDAIKNIEFKGYLPENSQKQLVKLMAAQHTKVEIFKDGEWTKTWYIGPSAQDHYGQIMLLDSDEYGKSDLPVIMKIKGLNGIIEPRFYADPNKWACTQIFGLETSDIRDVEVKYIKEPTRTFRVHKEGSKLEVYQQGKQLQNVDTSMIFRYLGNYKKIHFDFPNYELNEKQVDSVKKSTPFVVLTLTETNKKTTKLRLFRIKSELQENNEFGILLSADMDKFWCQLPNGSLVKCQYFVFNPILFGHIYFPLDMSKVEMGPAFK